MLQAFYHEATVEAGEETLRLTIDFAALDAIEGLTGKPFDASLQEMLGGAAPMALQARVVWGLLRRHHPEVSLDQATSLLFGDTGAATGVAIGKLMAAAFAEPDKGEKAKDARPPEPRGASKPSSTRGASKD